MIQTVTGKINSCELGVVTLMILDIPGTYIFDEKDSERFFKLCGEK